jgi:hypothetical protein
MTDTHIAAALRVLDAILAGQPWRVSRDELEAARDALARLQERSP